MRMERFRSGLVMMMMSQGLLQVFVVVVVWMCSHLMMMMKSVVVLEGRSVMSTGIGVEMKSFGGMHQINRFVGVNNGCVMVVVVVGQEIYMSMSMGRGICLEGSNWPVHWDLVVVVDMIDGLVGRFGPAWRWFRNWHPLLREHGSPCLFPVGHINGLCLPRFDPARLPGEFLCPKSDGRVLQTDDPTRERNSNQCAAN